MKKTYIGRVYIKNMKNLSEIEAEYCREIVLFFCREIYEMTFRKSHARHEFERMLSRQIESRLMETHMIRNYRIKYMDMEARRDAKLESLLHGCYDSGCDVEVLLEFGPGRYASIEFSRNSIGAI